MKRTVSAALVVGFALLLGCTQAKGLLILQKVKNAYLEGHREMTVGQAVENLLVAPTWTCEPAAGAAGAWSATAKGVLPHTGGKNVTVVIQFRFDEGAGRVELWGLGDGSSPVEHGELPPEFMEVMYTPNFKTLYAQQPGLPDDALLQKGMQNRALGRMRSLATNIQAFCTDAGVYPGQGSLGPADGLVPWLTPDYAREVPKDPWERSFGYQTFRPRTGRLGGETVDGGEFFILVCLGADGKLDPGTLGILRSLRGAAERGTSSDLMKSHLTKKTTNCFESDIIWFQDDFAQRPEGPQKHCQP